MQALSLLFLLALACAVLATRTPYHQLEGYTFENYVAEFNKRYTAAEYTTRKQIFSKNLATIRAHNALESSYKLGVNHLTDYTREEFKKLLGYKSQDFTPKYQVDYVPINSFVLPPYVDWREKGVITDVKDQGDCGSCWSFGTAETVESYYALSTGELHVLSEQQILDCTNNTNQCGGTGGCGGGTPEIAYEMIIEVGGLSSEWTYPYVSYFGQDYTCHVSNTDPFAKISNYTKLPPNQYQPVIETLANVGPLAINVDASLWQFYESGVFTGCNASYSDIDHVVQLVGYGTDEKAGDFWLVRNSWAPDWGEDGYIRLVRSGNDQNNCQKDPTPGDGTGCNGGPSIVTTCGPCGLLYDTSYPTITN